MENKVNTKKEAMLLLEIATTACSLMLKNGAEVYRVEDTGERIVLSKSNVKNVDVYATFNVVMVSFNVDGEIFTNLSRVKTRDNNLTAVDRINSFSRNYVAGKISDIDAINLLIEIKNDHGFKNIYKVFGGCLAACFYTALFKGNILDMTVSFIVTFLGLGIMKEVEKKKLGFVFNNFLSGLLLSIFSIIAGLILPMLNLDTVIIGGIMPYIPGLVITNAVRDLMSGDSTSGLTGAINAILIAVALIMGVVIPLAYRIKVLI